MRDALHATLRVLEDTGPRPTEVAGTALQLDAQLRAGDERLTPGEHALLREWLRRLSVGEP